LTKWNSGTPDPGNSSRRLPIFGYTYEINGPGRRVSSGICTLVSLAILSTLGINPIIIARIESGIV